MRSCRVVKQLAVKIIGAGRIRVQSGLASEEISEVRVELEKRWVELQRQACSDAATVGDTSDGQQGQSVLPVEEKQVTSCRSGSQKRLIPKNPFVPIPYTYARASKFGT